MLFFNEHVYPFRESSIKASQKNYSLRFSIPSIPLSHDIVDQQHNEDCQNHSEPHHTLSKYGKSGPGQSSIESLKSPDYLSHQHSSHQSDFNQSHDIAQSSKLKQRIIYLLSIIEVIT